MLLNREFSVNLKVIMSVLIQLHKFIILQMTQDVTIPKAMIETILIAWYTPLLIFKISQLLYLLSGRTMTTFWENTRSFIILAREYLMVPMAHVTNGKVKTNMFLIWCGPDREDMYDNFELAEHEMYDIDLITEQFELYCEPICNFHAARYKF